jgi:hypothetical protein
MRFFQNSDGGPHVGRVAGLLYAFILVLGCIGSHVLEPHCLAQTMFTVGWWLAFCKKRPTRTLSEMLNPIGILGLILVVLGLAGQAYFNGRPGAH